MKKVLFIDRDGTIIVEPADKQLDSFDKLEFMPGVITALAMISKETDYELVMVTNQDGLGSDSLPEETFWPVHNKLISILEGEGVIFKEVFIDRTLPEEKSPTRKPGTALLTRYLATGIDLSASFVIGDRLTDLQLATNLGCKAIFISREKSEAAILCTDDWNDVYRYLRFLPRVSSVERKTSETKIEVGINLDGSGKSNIGTGIGFFDHLLEQIPKHGGIDLTIRAIGDTSRDEHHTIEDVAIAFGEALSKALGKKKGIERYAFVLPMDDCLAQVSIDLGGRSWLVWEAGFLREKIGDVPTEMFSHFFRSFCDAAKCNLNIKAEGENEHHKVEAVFKSFARTLGVAVKEKGNSDIPSTKGSL
jgi:imidazoleglycerol-phosphate dehydratase / histidinol-phosphatase